ncbi:MAG: methylmalonyl-CoA mutase family protein [Acidobacteriota bacterium]
MRRHKGDSDEFCTVSGKPIRELYEPADLPADNFERGVGVPGSSPYTRGIYPNMYRGRLWTMRQFAGFGSPAETNQRLRFLLDQGQTGLSIAFDLPTLMGLDSDDPQSEGEVGKCGVAVDSLADMEELLADIRLDQVTTSMTINAPAAILLAMYVAVAEKQGCPMDRIGGTLQNDILKEYIAQKEWIFPPEPSMRLVVDVIEFCTRHLPRYNSISISGYHIREAGSTATQDLAFTLRDGIEYVESSLERGMPVDCFAPRLSFFFNCHNDFFEEIAKFRAARRLWARIMQERFGAKNERSWMCRFHTQTAGCSLTAQQPMNNVIRASLQTLAGVLGGTNSLHTNALDEALALPTEDSARLALRTQQIIAHESGVTNTVDPLGGSYFVESLTNEIEAEAVEYIRQIDSRGGMIAAISQGYPQREIQEAAYQYQRAVEKQEQIVVGVNAYTSDEEERVSTLQIGETVRNEQVARLRSLKRNRSSADVAQTLTDLRRAAREGDNLMPNLLEAVRAYATVGEMCAALREEFGVYAEPSLL